MAKKQRIDAYRDMLDLPHYEPVRHERMPREARAAQFAPFAALTGYGAAIDETARVTEARAELDESEKAALDAALARLAARVGEGPEVNITYFLPDARKAGGSYVRVTGRLRKIDPHEGLLTLRDGTVIPIDDVTAVDAAPERE